MMQRVKKRTLRAIGGDGDKKKVKDPDDDEEDKTAAPKTTITSTGGGGDEGAVGANDKDEPDNLPIHEGADDDASPSPKKRRRD